VPPEVLPRLFDKFMQADSSATRTHGGAGLGLSISRQLVELMGGQIGALPRSGSGSCFWFELPLEASANPASPPQPLPVRSVLVVSSSEIVRRVLSEQIVNWSISVRAVATLPEAVSLLHGAEPPDTVIADDLPVAELSRLAPLAKGILLANAPVAAPMPAGWAWLKKPATLTRLRAAVKSLHTQSTEAERRKPATVTARSPGMRVLLAEDNPVNQKVVLRMLEKLGCSADVASNGLEAVEKAGLDDYALVLMDCQMPEMDGYEATRILRARHGPHSPHIIALTAAAMEEHRKMCFDAGMDDFVTKPLSLARLQEVLAQWTREEPALAETPPAA
jgi:two-component system sensor histidine kinase/response regulator